MRFDPNKHHRQSIRLPGYDYTQGGWYFVTLVTRDRACLFENPLMRKVTEALWQRIPGHFPNVTLDEWMLMPNHLHGIVILAPAGEMALPKGPQGPRLVAASLGAVIGNYKSVSTRRLNQMRGLSAQPVWQRDYYERLIRSEEELRAIRQYIVDNPAKWTLDQYFASER